MNLLQLLFKAAIQGKGFDTRARKFKREPRSVIPHQSFRERARRMGGAEWEQAKEADRFARGL